MLNCYRNVNFGGIELKKLRIFAAIILLLTISGCSMQTHGNDLNAFCKRTESYGENYTVTISGFIAENDKYTKFFHIDGHDIMIRLGKDKKNRLNTLDIVLPSGAAESETALNFSKICISAFVNNEEICDELNVDEMLTHIKTTAPETKTTDAQGVGISVDSLEAGAVISVYFSA